MLNLEKIWNSRLFQNNKDLCGPFHEALEAVQLSPNAQVDRLDVLARLPVDVRQHALTCTTCLEAVDEFAAVRNLLLPHRTLAAPAPNPWFSSKVINAITAQQAEFERSETVWTGVRSLAPRLAAFSMLLLVLAGTLAFQMKQESQIRQMMRPAESLFESTPSAPLNDDVMASVEERR
jgi:hypothetical protein